MRFWRFSEQATNDNKAVKFEFFKHLLHSTEVLLESLEIIYHVENPVKKQNNGF